LTVFGDYACFYDLLYADKDYAGEVQYVAGLIQRFAPSSRSLLDLGCGSGRHARLFAEQGFEVAGVDRSAEMLRQASSQTANGASQKVSFTQGDIRTIRMGQTFDTVLAMFHVMSYQNSNDDFVAALRTVRAHLAPGGVFIFDCWYGPGVLSDRPSVRFKEVENEAIKVLRVATPAVNPNTNVVDVEYRIMVIDKRTGTCTELRENHAMRYFFLPEIELLCRQNGLNLVQSYAWLSERAPGFDSWYACAVCIAR